MVFWTMRKGAAIGWPIFGARVGALCIVAGGGELGGFVYALIVAMDPLLSSHPGMLIALVALEQYNLQRSAVSMFVSGGHWAT